MVFNKTVENFHRKFIKAGLSCHRSGWKIARREKMYTREFWPHSLSAAAIKLC